MSIITQNICYIKAKLINTSIITVDIFSTLQHYTLSQIWRVAPTPPNDKYQYTHFAHKINSFDTAPKKLLASDSRLRPDRYALEKGDMSKSGSEKSR
jgi:hypothetical protein